MESYPDFVRGKRWALLRRSTLVALGFATMGGLVCYRRVMERQGAVLKKAAVFRWKKGHWIPSQGPSGP